MNSLLLLLAASQGSFLSLAFLSGLLKSDYFKFFIGILFLVISVEIWTYWGIKSGIIQSQPIFPFWNLGPYLILPPALNYILQRLSNKSDVSSKWSILLLLPGVFEMMLNIFRYYSAYFFDFELFNSQNPIWRIYTQLIPLLWLAFVLIRHIKWKQVGIKYLFTHAYFSLFFVLWAVDYLFPRQIFTYVEMVLVATLYLFGYLAYLKPKWFSPPKNSILDGQYSSYNHRKHTEAFEKYMHEKSNYTATDLSLQQVANGIGVSPKYLSYLINKHYQQSFKNYLNQLRVNQVIADLKLQRHKKHTLLSIAFDAGFSSKSNFNEVFKKQTGMTPSKYLKKLE